jgi:mono/diheme cytochrome c family protein
LSRAGTDQGGIRQKPEPEHAYNLPRLHKMFFWSALLSLLVVVFWVVKVDFDKPWKKHQRAFMKLQAEETRKAIELENKKLGGGSTKQKLASVQEQLAKAQDELRGRRAEVDQSEKRLQKAHDDLAEADARNRAAKAEYDAFRYHVEEVRLEVHEGHASEKELVKAAKTLEKYTAERDAAWLAFEGATAAVDSAQAEVTRLTAGLNVAQKDLDALHANRQRLESRLATLQTNFANVVRNSPMMDFISPTLKVQQTVIEDLRFEVNYQTIPRVDRCTTCHQGIDKAGYEDAPQPFTSHPNLDLFLSSKSPHKLEDVGCTVCHAGWDRSVDFSWAAHTPRSHEQEAEWKKKHGFHHLHKWDWPMLPVGMTQSQCYKCHKDEVVLAGAPVLNQGREIFERAGCWNCHKVEGKLGPKVAPSLRNVAAKSSEEWIQRWIDDPTKFRPTTLMPKFFHLTNNNDEYSTRRGALEVAAITDYLVAKSEPLALQPMPARPGDAARGRQIVESVGCRACHLIGTDQPVDTATLRQRFGPNLMGLAAKTTPQWVFNWIRDPKAINPDTRMPDLRLTDEQVADVTAYLMGIPAPAEFAAQPLPAVEPELRDEVTLEFLRNTMSQKQAEIRLATMGERDQMMFLGEKLIGRYGCYGCHDLPGFEKAEPIGVELTEEGSKITAKFDFAHIGKEEVPHTRLDWIRTKVRDPRIWDRGVIKSPQDKLRMPQFSLAPDQVDAVTAFVLGLVREQVPASKRKMYDPHEVAANAGMRLVQNKNCMACHQIQSFGGDYAKLVDDPSLAPPLLTPTGAKVQPDFLYDFLKAPETIRPWLQVRMPTFGVDEAQADQLIAMFQGISRHDRRYPRFDPAELTPAGLQHGRELFGVPNSASWQASLKCNSCHPSGNVMPTTPQTQWGPNLAMAHRRLQPQWVIEWLRNPQSIQPGTRMPNFFYDGETPLTEDPEGDIRALRNYLWTLREAGGTRVTSR